MAVPQSSSTQTVSGLVLKRSGVEFRVLGLGVLGFGFRGLGFRV